jgi:GNAT superfamily N-acetyltransferase
MISCNVTEPGVSVMAIDLGHGFHLRLAEAKDHAALCMVCLQTGDSGADATGIEDAPDLVGMVYAVPYQVLEPDYCFVIEDTDGPCGYVMGTPDTVAFDKRLESQWFPKLRETVPAPPSDPAQWKGSDWVRDKIHNPLQVFPEALHPFPAQGHIDLLARARGKGVGKSAMRYLMEKLHRTGAPGIHLHVAPRNVNAQMFYKALGFQHLHDAKLPSHTFFLTRPL